MMKSLSLAIFLLFISTVFSEVVHDKQIDRKFLKQDVEGWTVLVNQEFVKASEWPTAKRVISNQLFQMKLKLNDKVIAEMQKVIIYVDKKDEGKTVAQYHPSSGWLKKNSFSTNKAKCIEICDPKKFLNYSKSQPFIMLHEFMHAYHHQVLTFENKAIIKLYKDAMKAGKYKKVRHVNGSEVDHYSATNHKEYFSEAAEAYFGTNDFFPFVKGEILKYDPEVCKFLKQFAK
ncbi:MAG: hypothetical protein NE334_01725 [Lentisphaeraceae bacterium]|nr:hypothetical protein [Lentisphaeraceae bacterium]